MVFATLTAPSFGAVHTRATRARRAAAAVPAAARCAGLPARRHALLQPRPRRGRRVPRRADLPRVLRLRRRAALEQPARRAVAPHDDLPAAQARAAQLGDHAEAAAEARVRVAYVKVAEYQQRGLVHVHVGDPARPRDAEVPRRRRPRARLALHGRAARGRAARRGRRGHRPGAAPRSAAATSPGARSSTSSTSASAARSNPAAARATSPSTRPRRPSRPAACCTA